MDITTLVQSVGVPVALLILILVAGAKGWWVYGTTYREARDERDEWKEIALRGTALARDAVSTAEVVSLKERRRRA